MRPATRFAALAALALVAGPDAAAGQPPLPPVIGPPRPPAAGTPQPGAARDQERLEDVALAVGPLLVALEDLYENTRAAPPDADIRDHLDDALFQAVRFRSTLQGTTGGLGGRWRVLQDFEALDRDVRYLIAHADGFRGGRLHQDLDHLRVASAQLQFLMYRGDPTKFRAVVLRQAEVLKGEAGGLRALTQGHPLSAAFGRFAAAADRFLTVAFQNSDNPAAVAREFAAVDRAWAELVRETAGLRPRENAYFLARVGRMDAIHANLFETMGLPGPRARIVIRADRGK